MLRYPLLNFPASLVLTVDKVLAKEITCTGLKQEARPASSAVCPDGCHSAQCILIIISGIYISTRLPSWLTMKPTALLVEYSDVRILTAIDIKVDCYWPWASRQ